MYVYVRAFASVRNRCQEVWQSCLQHDPAAPSPQQWKPQCLHELPWDNKRWGGEGGAIVAIAAELMWAGSISITFHRSPTPANIFKSIERLYDNTSYIWIYIFFQYNFSIQYNRSFNLQPFQSLVSRTWTGLSCIAVRPLFRRSPHDDGWRTLTSFFFWAASMPSWIKWPFACTN